MAPEGSRRSRKSENRKASNGFGSGHVAGWFVRRFGVRGLSFLLPVPPCGGPCGIPVARFLLGFDQLPAQIVREQAAVAAALEEAG
mmetsp:Transcript_17885/g.41234  ORF Transcript_17885/g.41234 Transcript_17885/m.41234 type:complete len:86 (-) Transcript_17885:355-612(-)